MKKLEIVINAERVNKTVGHLQAMFPQLSIIARTSFFFVLGCYVIQLTEDERLYLEDLVESKAVIRFRCKREKER